MTKEISFDEVKIAEGKITDCVDNESSWLIVSDEEKAAKIKMGDYVKVNYQETIIEKVIEGTKEIVKPLLR